MRKKRDLKNLQQISENGNVEKFEKEAPEFKAAISSALSGLDVTRPDTLLGATQYETSDDIKTLRENAETEYKAYMIIENMLFGIKEGEYNEYLKSIVDKKIDEVIYELDLKKYLEGIEEGKGGYDTSAELIERQKELNKIFDDVKKNILDYYKAGTYVEECGGIKLKKKTSVVLLEKTNVYQESEKDESDGSYKVTDHFTLTADSNYGVKWELTYTVGKEGKIQYESFNVNSDLVHEAIPNF